MVPQAFRVKVKVTAYLRESDDSSTPKKIKEIPSSEWIKKNRYFVERYSKSCVSRILLTKAIPSRLSSLVWLHEKIARKELVKSSGSLSKRFQTKWKERTTKRTTRMSSAQELSQTDSGVKRHIHAISCDRECLVDNNAPSFLIERHSLSSDEEKEIPYRQLMEWLTIRVRRTFTSRIWTSWSTSFWRTILWQSYSWESNTNKSTTLSQGEQTVFSVDECYFACDGDTDVPFRQSARKNLFFEVDFFSMSLLFVSFQNVPAFVLFDCFFFPSTFSFYSYYC